MIVAYCNGYRQIILENLLYFCFRTLLYEFKPLFSNSALRFYLLPLRKKAESAIRLILPFVHSVTSGNVVILALFNLQFAQI